MNELETCTWTGASGRKYTYTRYSAGTKWNPVSANYICAKTVGDRSYAKYIGETGSLQERMPDHEKWPCCNQNGVNEIHINRDAKSSKERRKQEKDLVDKYAPPCNK